MSNMSCRGSRWEVYLSFHMGRWRLHQCMMPPAHPLAVEEERPGRIHVHCKIPCTRCHRCHYTLLTLPWWELVRPCLNCKRAGMCSPSVFLGKRTKQSQTAVVSITSIHLILAVISICCDWLIDLLINLINDFVHSFLQMVTKRR